MLYNQYKCLQQYINGMAQDVYKKGDLVKTADFDSLEACENNGISTNGCFSWINTTDNKIFYFINGKYEEATNNPVCIGKPNNSLNFSNVHNPSFTANYRLTSLDLSYIDTSDLNNMQDMFTNCISLVSLNLSNFNTAKVKTFNSMFNGCEKLSSLNLSSFTTDECTDMGLMFVHCKSLVSLNLSNFNTAKVKDISFMFGYCENLKFVNVSSFDTSSVLYFSAMFSDCYNLTNLDLSSFTTASKINSCAYMFDNCRNLTKLNLSKFGPVSDTDGKNMFRNCDKLNHIICTESFKNWCKLNQDNIKLPAAMREGGTGTWEIVG